jgi:hypothetical protein
VTSTLLYILDAPKLHEQLTQAMDYLKQADTGECKVIERYKNQSFELNIFDCRDILPIDKKLHHHHLLLGN